MKVFTLNNPPQGVVTTGVFNDESSLSFSQELIKKLGVTSHIKILKMGDNPQPPKIAISIADFTGNIVIYAGSSGRVSIGKCGNLNVDLRIGHNSIINISDNCTSNGAKIVAIRSEIEIGEDCMISDDVLIQGFDQHGIVDLSSMKIVNSELKKTVIGRHVWLGRRCTVMPGANIQDGVIVGALSLVTGVLPSCTIVGGVPARVLKKNYSWSRPWTHIDPKTQEFFNSLIAD